MTTGFLTPHHAAEYFLWIEIATGIVEQRSRFGSQYARNETCAHLRAASVAACGIKGEPADRLATADHVSDHSDHRSCHFGEVEARICERRLKWNRRLADIDDAHHYR